MASSAISDAILCAAKAKVAAMRPDVLPGREADFDSAAARYLESARKIAEGLSVIATWAN